MAGPGVIQKRRRRTRRQALIQGGAISRTTQLVDTFTDPDHTALADHTPDTDLVGGGWSMLTAGTVKILSNQACIDPQPVSTHFDAILDCGAFDFILTETMTLAEAYNAAYNAILFRLVDGNNFWQARAMPANYHEISIVERTSGTFYTRASTAKTMSLGGVYACRLVASGQDILFDVAGTIVSYSSSVRADKTKIGLQCQSHGSTPSTKHDNLQVQTW